MKELAAIENDDSIAHQECFSLIVRDMHQGRAESALNADHFLAESRAQREVEAGERFVKQKHARLSSELRDRSRRAAARRRKGRWDVASTHGQVRESRRSC